MSTRSRTIATDGDPERSSVLNATGFRGINGIDHPETDEFRPGELRQPDGADFVAP